MGLFDAINTALTGADASQTWLNAVSENIANMNDVTSPALGAYQTRYVVMSSAPAEPGGTGPGTAVNESIGGGVEVAGIALGSPAGVLEYDPSNPLADKQGMVRSANVDLGAQMTDMVMAQNSYEANIATITRAQQAYQAALGLKV
jgi:flagellar basal-body rod protein FlgC